MGLRHFIGEYIKRWDNRTEAKMYLKRLTREKRLGIIHMSRKERRFFLELDLCMWTQRPPTISESEFSEMVFRLEQRGVVKGTWRPENDIYAPHIAEGCRLTPFGEQVLLKHRCGKARINVLPHKSIILIGWYIFISLIITFYILMFNRY